MSGCLSVCPHFQNASPRVVVLLITSKEVAYDLIVRCTFASLQRVLCGLHVFTNKIFGCRRWYNNMDDVVHCYYRPNYSEIGIRPAKAACTPNFFDWTYVRPPV